MQVRRCGREIRFGRSQIGPTRQQLRRNAGRDLRDRKLCKTFSTRVETLGHFAEQQCQRDCNLPMLVSAATAPCVAPARWWSAGSLRAGSRRHCGNGPRPHQVRARQSRGSRARLQNALRWPASGSTWPPRFRKSRYAAFHSRIASPRIVRGRPARPRHAAQSPLHSPRQARRSRLAVRGGPAIGSLRERRTAQLTPRSGYSALFAPRSDIRA